MSCTQGQQYVTAGGRGGGVRWRWERLRGVGVEGAFAWGNGHTMQIMFY